MAVGAAQFAADARLRPEINVDIFTTGTEAYHAYRIEPPEVVVDVVATLLYAGGEDRQ